MREREKENCLEENQFESKRVFQRQEKEVKKKQFLTRKIEKER